MRVLRAMAGLALACAAVPAQAQWSPVDGGVRHAASGFVCVSQAGGFALAIQVATEKGFSCRYKLQCAADQSCGGKAGFAAVTWNPALDFASQFRTLALQQNILVVDEAGPEWAGSATLFARAGDSFGAWWTLRSNERTLNIALFYNAATAPGAKLLAEAVVRANP